MLEFIPVENLVLNISQETKMNHVYPIYITFFSLSHSFCVSELTVPMEIASLFCKLIFYSVLDGYLQLRSTGCWLVPICFGDSKFWQ